MNVDLTYLCGVLEAELAVGQTLVANLEALKKAIVAWDIERLLREIEARQPAIDELVLLETQRNEILRNLDEGARQGGLRGLIASMSGDSPERQRLAELREKNRCAFTMLHAAERNLIGLMENLLAHIHEALAPLTAAGVPLYGETGAARSVDVGAALIHSKA